VDTTKWRYGIGNSGDLLHYYTNREENVSVSNGTLKIIALKEYYMGFDHTSGMLVVKNNVGWHRGRIEARIQLPGTPGFVPAFWMLPVDNIYGWWPASGEIDIMEYVTTMPGTIYGTVHTDYYNLFGGPQPPQGATSEVPDAETAFHVYAIEWNEEKIDFFVDDNKYYTFSNQQTGYEKWPFDQPFYTILNLAVGGSWSGPPTENTVFPAIMLVDYVRVYQDVDDILISGSDFVAYNSQNVFYSVPDIDEAVYTWEFPGGANIVTGQNTSTVKVDWNVFGGMVKAHVNSEGCEKEIEYPVSVSSNFLSNPGFEKGVKDWEAVVGYPASADLELTQDAYLGDNAVRINVNSLGNHPWDVQVSQHNLKIESGQIYHLSFWAKANRSTALITAVLINSNDYTAYSGETFVLSDSWERYSLEFMAGVTAPVNLNVDLGLETGTYYLDDFSFSTPDLRNLNLLKNADFTDGSMGWDFITLGGAQASGLVTNEEFVITIYDEGTYPWDIHLRQNGILIENGKEYVVEFDAYAESSREIYAIVGESNSPWTVYCGTQKSTLTTIKNRYSFTFTMNEPTDNFARLGFDVGASDVDVYFDNIRISESRTVAIADQSVFGIPEDFTLLQNYPNPFNLSTTILYQIKKNAFVEIDMFDIGGRKLKSLVRGRKDAGRHRIRINADELSSGVYICRIKVDGFMQCKKLTLLK
jgi:beta-glucanase (GH16 family)